MLRFPLALTTGILSLCITLSLSARADQSPFSGACERAETLTVAAVGDILLHGPLQRQAYASEGGFQSLWREVRPLWADADLVYGNLEGPAAAGVTHGGRQGRDPGLVFDGSTYSGYPMFNYNPRIAREVLRAGFSVVSTANNHAMDRGPLGADRTIEALQDAGLPFTGTRTRAEAAAGKESWHVVTEKNGWRIAWLACSFSTNGLPDPQRQVLGCFRDAPLIERELRSLSSDPGIDAVILTPHWGEVEYTERIEPSQRALAVRFAEAGVTAILGNHPHVTKPWEKITTRDGREVFVIYSIGNFVSAQGALAKKTSAIVYVGLSRGPGRKAWVNGMTYIPLYMLSRPYTVVPADADPRAPGAATALLERLLGRDRRISSRERITTNPECR